MPMTPADIGWDEKGAKDAYTGAREIRDKYLICSILWDLGQEARAGYGEEKAATEKIPAARRGDRESSCCS